MNNDCSKYINEALTAGGINPSLPKLAANHISNCPNCQKTLAALALLSANRNTILPSESNALLKSKIIAKLAPAVAAKATIASAGSNSLIANTTGKLLICSAIITTISVGSYSILNNNTDKEKTVSINSVSESSNIKTTSKTDNKNQELESENDLRDLSPASYTSQTVPSSTKE